MASTLYVWGEHPALPSLDPQSLYAASLLQHSFGPERYVISAAQPLLVDRVPSLQEGAAAVASSADQILALLRKEERIDNELMDRQRADAVALHALLDDRLTDLIVSVMRLEGGRKVIR